LSLFGGGGGGDGDGGDDRNPWNFRPLTNFQQQMFNPQPFFWPVTTTLGLVIIYKFISQFKKN
jgi:hypothetical protein